MFVGVEIDILDRWNLELACMTRYSQEVVDDRALKTVGGQLALVSHLGVVLVEVLGELDLRLLQQFHVAHTTDDDTQLDRIVGLDIGLVNLGRDIERAHTAREIGRTRGQRGHINRDAWRNNLLLDLDIAGTAVEESLEGVYITVLLHHDTVERNAWNFELARLLWKHDILAPRYRLVRAAVEHLDRKTLLSGQRNLTGIEVLQVRHLAIEVGQSDKGINLIGQQDGLLLKDTTLGGADLDEQVVARNTRACRT